MFWCIHCVAVLAGILAAAKLARRNIGRAAYMVVRLLL